MDFFTTSQLLWPSGPWQAYHDALYDLKLKTKGDSQWKDELDRNGHAAVIDSPCHANFPVPIRHSQSSFQHRTHVRTGSPRLNPEWNLAWAAFPVAVL